MTHSIYALKFSLDHSLTVAIAAVYSPKVSLFTQPHRVPIIPKAYNVAIPTTNKKRLRSKKMSVPIVAAGMIIAMIPRILKAIQKFSSFIENPPNFLSLLVEG